MASRKVLLGVVAGTAVLGTLVCVVGGSLGFWYVQHRKELDRVLPKGEATLGTKPAVDMPNVLPVLILSGTDTSLPWPVPGITSSQCDDLTDGGMVRSDGCITMEIRCGETIVGHTRGGVNHFDTKFYEKGFCTPATTNHNGGDERVYLFRTPPGKHRVYFTLDTPCADLDVSAMRWSGDACPTDPRTLGDCEMIQKTGTTRERVSVPAMDQWTYLVVVEGKDDEEGAFALTAQCGPWR